jgi:rhamnosyltransferase subunit B
MTSSKRIILATFGSFGDIHPYMAIAIELQARGHEPLIATMALYREKIEAAGISFAPLSPNIPPPQEQDQELIEKILEPKSGPKFLMEEVLYPSVRASYRELLEIVAGSDLLVSHPITFAGPLVGYKTGSKWISSVLSPVGFFSAYDVPVPPFWPWLVELKRLGPGVMKILSRIAKQAYQPKTIYQFRDELGVPAYGNPVFEGQHSPHGVLALFSRVFAQPQPDWPPHTTITGFPFYDEDGLLLPHELSEFLDNGPPPIVFTLGSSAVWIGREFFHESIAAAKALRRRAVFLIGDKRNLPLEPLPPEMIAVDYAPFHLLLPRACVMVHPGGVGTTAQALRAGVPTLIVPFAFDQPDNAAHAARLGTSRTLYRAKYSAARVTKELGILLDNPQYARKAREVSDFLKQENGAAVASDAIERAAAAGRSVKEELVYASGD